MQTILFNSLYMHHFTKIGVVPWAQMHPLWTLTPATYHVHFQLNCLQSPSLKNKEHDFNPGILKEIFTFAILQPLKSTYKAVFTNPGSDPKSTKCRDSRWLEHTLDPAPEDFSFFFSLLPLQLFQQGVITLIARYLVLVIYLYCYYLILGWDNSLINWSFQLGQRKQSLSGTSAFPATPTCFLPWSGAVCIAFTLKIRSRGLEQWKCLITLAGITIVISVLSPALRARGALRKVHDFPTQLWSPHAKHSLKHPQRLQPASK